MKMNKENKRRLLSLLILIVVLAFFSIRISGFMTPDNMISWLREASSIGLIAVGSTFVIITAGIDISVGSTMALASMCCANMLRFTGMNFVLAIIISFIIGTACGALNGFLIAKLHIPDFIVTLATMNIFRGLTTSMSRNDMEAIQNAMILNDDFAKLGGGIGKVYWVIILFIIAVIIGQVILRMTKLGTYTYAVGSNAAAATLTGIPTEKVKIFAYMFTGALSGVAGIMITARMMTANVYTGEGMEFNVIAAVVLGGCSLQGGRGDVIGSMIGTLLIALINSGTTQMGIESAFQPIIKGLIIFAAILIDIISVKRHAGTIQEQ